MPLFEFLCQNCGATKEILIMNSDDKPVCRVCGSHNMAKQMSAPSSLTGQAADRWPGPGDTACCGSSPGQAAGCAGPGSCCGKRG